MDTSHFDHVLKQLQDGSLCTMEMLSKTFAGMLIQFQQQLSKNKQNEQRFEEISTQLDNISERQAKMETKLTEINNAMNKKFFDVEEEMNANETNADAQLQSMKGELSDKFQGAESQIEQLDMTKADMNDLKRKADKLEFDELGEIVRSIKKAFTANVQEIENKMEETVKRFRQDTTDAFFNFGEEINKLHTAIFEMEQEYKDKLDHIMDNVGPHPRTVYCMLAIIDELQAQREDIDQKTKIPVAGSTSSGRCFSCGSPMKSAFPQLKARTALKANTKRKREQYW